MHEEDLPGHDTERVELRGEGVAGDERAGRSGYGHGWAVSCTAAPRASGFPPVRPAPIDRRSFTQVRLGMPK
ncbi:hypothetical protein Saso_07310 [Streptomyces asoensis]|uniref:Uncharacterized protein n=1 Tax=Streptomyces asoensis TaxID=249586 RepID=A0ABQ3RTA1_9ACTN|nr:hypothetical protein GCM10010496_72540 [Streptomyces asoensis]GHI59081.1 hypothetical protein Saso_07310 [Streptomyces asoensis]